MVTVTVRGRGGLRRDVASGAFSNAAAVSITLRSVSLKRAAGAPSMTAWSKLSVSGSIDLATMRPSRTTGRSTMPPTVVIKVSGATGMAQPQPRVNIPSDVTPTAGPNVAATPGLVAAILRARADQPVQERLALPRHGP